jgi:hypothetical protein
MLTLACLQHISHEAREKGLRHYQLHLGTTRASGIPSPYIYVNLAVDIICPVGDFADDAFEELYTSSHIQTMALNLNDEPEQRL